MRIAVDATAVRSLNHGVGTYVAGLLRNLVLIEPKNHYVAYMTPQAVENFRPLALPPERIILSPVAGPRPLRLIWEQIRLPYVAAGQHADLLWGCHNSLPRFGKSPQVVTIHDVGMLTLPHFYPAAKTRYFRWAITHAVRQAEIVVAVSAFTKAELVSVLHVPESRVRVVHNGVGAQFRVIDDPARVSRVRKRYSLPPKFIFSLGVPEPKKNLARVIGAYAELKSRRRDTPRLVLGGGRAYGWKNKDIYRLAQSMGDDIVLTDFVDPDDLPAVYSMAEVFVFPSLYEGFGLPPVEAMACGTPVVSSKAASLPEVLGEAALLVDPTRQEEIADAMQRVLEDSALRAGLQTRGLANAGRFSWRKAAQEMVSVFRDAAERAS